MINVRINIVSDLILCIIGIKNFVFFLNKVFRFGYVIFVLIGCLIRNNNFWVKCIERIVVVVINVIIEVYWLYVCIFNYFS